MAERCATWWFCAPCGTRHSCALDPLHSGEHRNKRVRELDVCQWDGRTALRFPDPAKGDGETIFQPRKAARRVMLALTLHRPWDTAILRLGKPVENRDWPPMPGLVGSRIAIHSGLTWDTDGARLISAQAIADGIPPSVVNNALDQAYRVKGAIIGTVKVAYVLRRDAPHPADPLHLSPWFFGKYGWVCEKPFALAEPVLCRGAQKLWKLPPDVEARVLAMEAARAA